MREIVHQLDKDPTKLPVVYMFPRNDAPPSPTHETSTALPTAAETVAATLADPETSGRQFNSIEIIWAYTVETVWYVGLRSRLCSFRLHVISDLPFIPACRKWQKLRPIRLCTKQFLLYLGDSGPFLMLNV